MSRFRVPRDPSSFHYRCFEGLRPAYSKDDTTVLFAENGGGKTALLTAIAMGFAVFQTRRAEKP